jgi:hypothetical protein
MGARWYDAYIARFVSADTIVPDPGNPQDLNRYAYVRNSPLRFIDPSGHFILPAIGLIAVVAGGGAIVNWSFQVSDNHYNQGMSWADAVYHKNLDEGEMVQAAAVAGSVATTAATVGPALVIAGGEALTGAGILAGSSTLYYAGIHTASAGETALAQLWMPYGTTSSGMMTGARNRALSRLARETGEEFTICGGYGESRAGIVGRARAHPIGHKVEVEEMGMPAWRNTGVPQGNDVDLWRPYSPEVEEGIRKIFRYSKPFDYYSEYSMWRHTQPPGSKTYFPNGSMYQSWALWNQKQ